ncbi:MAG: CHAP domain-containing protein [Micrococcales bacterium]|nr:CHAP domain-containing protein [Micrococcales bacterium]
MAGTFPKPIANPAPQGTAARLVQIAESYVGYAEGPKDNETIMGAFTKANFLPWCGSFCMFVANAAGVKIPNTVSTVAGADAFKKQKRWYDNDGVNTPEPGDIVYFDFPGDGVDRISHVGIIVKDNKDGSMTCLEGNTSGIPKGDQRNGGEVCKKIRAYKKSAKQGLPMAVVGWGRPDYEGSAANPVAPKVVKEKDTTGKVYPGETIDPGEAGIHVKTVQAALGIKPADGQFGPVTKKAVIAHQKAKKLPVTGIVDAKTWKSITGLPVK